MATAMKRVSVSTVNEYINTFPLATQRKLIKLRQTIKATAPQAEEVISYRIAGYKYHGMLIYFAGFTNHISIYPAPREAEVFKKKLAAYKGGKGTVQFPLDKPLPLTLITKIIKYRAKENLAKSKIKLAKK